MDSRPTMTGAPAPAVVAQALDGSRGPLAGGRPAVVNFWAPWCPPCNEELPQLVDLAERYDGVIDFVGISVELDDLDSVRESIDRFGIPYPQFLADDALMEQFFGSEAEAALPATFVFDRDGRLRRLFRGAVTEAELDTLLASFRDEAVSEDTLRMLAETYLKAGDYAQAAEFYEQLALLEPTRLDQIGQAWQRQRALDWIAKARAHRALGEVAAARESYGQALRMEPQSRGAPGARSAGRPVIRDQPVARPRVAPRPVRRPADKA